MVRTDKAVMVWLYGIVGTPHGPSLVLYYLSVYLQVDAASSLQPLDLLLWIELGEAHPAQLRHKNSQSEWARGPHA
jgi:hypothetical protein